MVIPRLLRDFQARGERSYRSRVGLFHGFLGASFPQRNPRLCPFWRKGGGGVLLKTKSALTESRIRRPLLQILVESRLFCAQTDMPAQKRPEPCPWRCSRSFQRWPRRARFCAPPRSSLHQPGATRLRYFAADHAFRGTILVLGSTGNPSARFQHTELVHLQTLCVWTVIYSTTRSNSSRRLTSGRHPMARLWNLIMITTKRFLSAVEGNTALRQLGIQFAAIK